MWFSPLRLHDSNLFVLKMLWQCHRAVLLLYETTSSFWDLLYGSGGVVKCLKKGVQMWRIYTWSDTWCKPSYGNIVNRSSQQATDCWIACCHMRLIQLMNKQVKLHSQDVSGSVLPSLVVWWWWYWEYGLWWGWTCCLSSGWGGGVPVPFIPGDKRGPDTLEETQWRWLRCTFKVLSLYYSTIDSLNNCTI